MSQLRVSQTKDCAIISKTTQEWIKIRLYKSKFQLLDVSPVLDRTEVDEIINAYLASLNQSCYWATVVNQGDPPFCLSCSRHECKCEKK